MGLQFWKIEFNYKVDGNFSLEQKYSSFEEAIKDFKLFSKELKTKKWIEISNKIIRSDELRSIEIIKGS